MNNLESPELMHAMQVLRWLVNEIGPRPAGSAAEQKAMNELAHQLEESGCQPLRLPVRFAAPPGFLPFYSIAGVAFLLISWLLPVIPWLALILLILPIALPEISWWLSQKRPLNAKSENLLVMLPDTSPTDLDLLLVAHLDTAKANPTQNIFWSTFQYQAFASMRQMGWVLVLISLPIVMGWTPPAAVQIAVLLGGTMLGGLFIGLDLWQQANRLGYAPGAYDNASGAAIITALAEQYAHMPKLQLNIGFLYTTAEETGLHGAARAAEWLKSQNAAPHIVVLDQVGAGHSLRYIRQAWKLKPIKTDPTMNEYLSRAAPDIQPLDYFRRSGDFEPFQKAGFKSCAIETTGSFTAGKAYHTLNDNLSVIEPQTMQQVLDMLQRLIYILNRQQTNHPEN